ncbi:MAG: hypothetical protein ACD_30C00110G0015 [uncultured bacterium]|uniref:Uncharacterized protein n=2 Tax=Candidatus Daviesiibacteriota TaxID=1752718 RepID=A0A1F5K5M4_9BACT|nr:MAG: hypothetical protein ACD_30C00110G0015 [uncultured bacterium]KKQ15171.1 MAG: hypothetical protein US28_C0021G0002 [Candidatus Daviesbacteria bacterium GW2011_GWA1_36_8]OGE33032.1 MAG: hypothetical protein A3C99_02045 [Candidatus Daviesbacteria bacterium RIFCSPHIGHO2_02_FULL_37_9]OGE36217.1 MAG: hypothetical protein A3E66_05435 [Candidatus Daviesbacteria bacterium RIFCSPHIGHO2_12_FULL_37_16]
MSNKENPFENFVERWPMPESMHSEEFHDWIKGLDPEDQKKVSGHLSNFMRRSLDGMSLEQVIGKDPITEAPDAYQNAFPSTDIPDIFKSAFEKGSDSK